jgi:hypothetical protein
MYYLRLSPSNMVVLRRAIRISSHTCSRRIISSVMLPVRLCSQLIRTYARKSANGKEIGQIPNAAEHHTESVSSH